MAASRLQRSILCLANSNFAAPLSLFGNSSKAIRSIKTSAVSLKTGPKTVGIPAWAKAAQKRRKSLGMLDEPKSYEQIEAENRLAASDVKLDFYTTTRNRRPPMKEGGGNETQLSMTRDEQAFVCYHPMTQDPKRLLMSKEASERQYWELTPDEIDQYRDHMEPEEVEEAKQLRQQDSKIWTTNALSRLLKVKPLTIILKAPLTKEQKYELHIERKLINNWTNYQRKEYRAYQELERQRYMTQTRGQAMNAALGLKD